MELITLENRNSQKIIKDVVIYPLKVNLDETGGTLVETMRRDWKEIYGLGREFFMQYFSVTPSGFARDEDKWHLHHKQEDRFLVASGEVVVSIADYRKDSETYGLLNLYHMDPVEDLYIVLVPKGTLHGFLAVGSEPAILLNFPTALYDPEDELRTPYEEAKIKTPDGQNFSWDKVREMFPNLNKS